jgi:hypothetical protein
MLLANTVPALSLDIRSPSHKYLLTSGSTQM